MFLYLVVKALVKTKGRNTCLLRIIIKKRKKHIKLVTDEYGTWIDSMFCLPEPESVSYHKVI